MKKSLVKIALYLFFLFPVIMSCEKKDENSAPSINDQTFVIDENSSLGTIVGQIIASDPDSQLITYNIIGGNTNDAFSISSEDGIITVQNEEAIDFETNPVFTLQVEVTDDNNSSASANIDIELRNIEITASGLVLYMPFEGNLNDLSDYHNNGIDFTSSNYVSGVKAQALDFNGTDDYIQLTNSINSQNGLSFSFWVKTRGAKDTENNGAIVSKYSMAEDNRSFMIYSFGSYENRIDNRLSASFYKYGTLSDYHDHVKSYMEPGELTVFPNPSLWTISNPMRLILDAWTHCIINVNSSSVEIWINGELCTKKLREYSTYYNSDEPVYIGNNNSGGQGTNNHFNGILDELRIYNRGLTTDEIKTLFRE
jgi:hypothetical protein